MARFATAMVSRESALSFCDWEISWLDLSQAGRWRRRTNPPSLPNPTRARSLTVTPYRVTNDNRLLSGSRYHTPW